MGLAMGLLKLGNKGSLSITSRTSTTSNPNSNKLEIGLQDTDWI